MMKPLDRYDKATALHSTQNMYPEIVGEGEVTSVTLPDGSVQFFFMPTLKWWQPNANQCQPYPTTGNPMFANTNSSIPTYNNNVGTWFIRRMSNTLPQNAFNLQSQRNEPPRTSVNTAWNMSTHDFGYQVKFHNDGWTSTTDLVYFYPSLRQRDFVFTPPCKDKTVQIDARPVADNTARYHEVVCSKPCICGVDAKPMSLESLADPNMASKDTKGTANDTCCVCRVNKRNKRGKNKKIKRNKPKNVICICDSTANIDSTADKSVTTYADKGNSCAPGDGRETQTSVTSAKCDDDKPIIIKSKVKPKLRFSKSYSSRSTTDECSCDDIIKKLKRHKHAKYKLKKLMKCDCGGESTSGFSENEKMVSIESKDGCRTPFCIISKCCCKDDAQDPPSEHNTAVEQWLNSDDVCPQCKLSSVPISISSKTATEEKSLENFLNNGSHACDSNCTSSCR